MSVTNMTVDHSGPGDPGQHWEAAVTQKEATRLGISRNEYDQAALIARMAVEEHQRVGTPRDRWEPTLIQNSHMAEPFITDGEQELASRLEAEADPVLDNSQDLLENVKANLDEIAEHIQPIATPESGSNHSVLQAVTRVEQHDTKIERDEAVGKHHHRRASQLLQRLASLAPWVEAVGFLTFVTYYLNVPVLEPWLDWLGWSFAATVVVAIIVGQTWLVRHAARSHNHAREARADGNRQEADRGATRRNWYLWLTALTAVAITSGMIWRGIAALGGASLSTTSVMVFVAAVTGVLLPTLGYLGVALDGSKISRERDSLSADLDDDLDAYLENINHSRRDIGKVAEAGDTLRHKTFPDICATTQEAVDAAYSSYSTVRLLIGGLSAKPPAKTAKTIASDENGDIHGYIGTSIPGVRTINLTTLFDRLRRLTEIEKQRIVLLQRIDALPSHPWGKSRTA